VGLLNPGAPDDAADYRFLAFKKPLSLAKRRHGTIE
jgi:hypothetical protein